MDSLEKDFVYFVFYFVSRELVNSGVNQMPEARVEARLLESENREN